MSHWTYYKNPKIGARRSDGIYVRRSWGWYDRETRPTITLLRGWDVCRSLTTLGTYPDQPLDQVLAKVDGHIPLGDGRWQVYRYTTMECFQCGRNMYREGRVFTTKVEMTCPHCGRLHKTFMPYEVRELELRPEQKLCIDGKMLESEDGNQGSEEDHGSGPSVPVEAVEAGPVQTESEPSTPGSA